MSSACSLHTSNSLGRFDSNDRLWASKLGERAWGLLHLPLSALYKTTDLTQNFLVVLRDCNRSL